MSPTDVAKDVIAVPAARVIRLAAGPILADTLQEVIAASAAAPAITEVQVAHATGSGPDPIRVDIGRRAKHHL